MSTDPEMSASPLFLASIIFWTVYCLDSAFLNIRRGHAETEQSRGAGERKPRQKMID